VWSCVCPKMWLSSTYLVHRAASEPAAEFRFGAGREATGEMSAATGWNRRSKCHRNYAGKQVRTRQLMVQRSSFLDGVAMRINAPRESKTVDEDGVSKGSGWWQPDVDRDGIGWRWMVWPTSKRQGEWEFGFPMLDAKEIDFVVYFARRIFFSRVSRMCSGKPDDLSR